MRKRLYAIICCLLLLVQPLAAQAVEKGFTVFHGDRKMQRVAVTVDDCYNIARVQEILDLCDREDVPVTFFVIGKALKRKDGETWRRAVDMGCEIGNHTWGHRNMGRMSGKSIRQSLQNTQKKLNELLGFDYPMQVMRPPMGKLARNPKHMSDMVVVEAIEQAGYAHAVRWDVSQTDPDEALKETQNGSILLYHARARDVRCLQKLIPELKKAGYRLVTVSELLGLEEQDGEVQKRRQRQWLVQEEAENNNDS